MQIYLGKGYISINADINVTKYATDDYMSADISEYNLAQPTGKELRALYNKAQRVFYDMRAQHFDVEECKVAREDLANKYQLYKEALLAHYKGHTFEPKKITLESLLTI